MEIVDLESFKPWWKLGSLYQTYKNINDIAIIDKKYLIENDSVSNMEDFINVFNKNYTIK